MSTRGGPGEHTSLDTSNAVPPHQQLFAAPAAYSRCNLARLFVGRSEARLLSQIEHALLDYNKTNNTSYTILPNLIIRFKSKNRTHLRFVTRLLDPTNKDNTTTVTNNDASNTDNQSSPSKSTILPNSTTPSTTTLQYTFVLQPSESLIYPVNEMSNESPVRDDIAWTTFGAQETARLERLMDQQGLQLTVYDVARAAWRLVTVRKWLRGLQKDYENSLKRNNEQDMPGAPAVAAATTGGPTRLQSACILPLPMRTLVSALPSLVTSLNDYAAISNLAAEIELLGDDDDNTNGGVGGSNREQNAQRQQRVQPDELLSMIPFASKASYPSAPSVQPPPPPSPVMPTAAAQVIKTEPENQANTGPTALEVAPTQVHTNTLPASTNTGNTTATTNKDDERFATPPFPLAVVIKQEPADDSQKGPPLAAADTKDKPSGSRANNLKQSLPPQQKSTPSAEIGGGSKDIKAAPVLVSATAMNANEKKRKQEKDSAEKKRKGPIAWAPQPSHPEDQPLIPNEDKKKKKKKATPPAVETLAPSKEKEKETTVAAAAAAAKEFISSIPSTTITTTQPPQAPTLAALNSLPTTHFNAQHPARPHISSMGAGIIPPGGSITCLVPRKRPHLEKPRYINTSASGQKTEVEAMTTASDSASNKRHWERILTRWHGVDINSFSGEFLVRPIPEAPQAPPPGAGFSSWFDQMHTEPAAPPPPDEDIDPCARNTSTYFDELNPTIKTYGVFPECTVKIPAMIPSALPYAEALGAGVDFPIAMLDDGAPPSLENMQFKVTNIVQPGSLPQMGRDHSTKFIEPSPITNTTRQKHQQQQPHPDASHATDRRQPAVKKPSTDTQAQQYTKNTKLAGNALQNQRASIDNNVPEERSPRRSLSGDRPNNYRFGDEDDYDTDGYDSRSRSTSSRSRSRSYSRSRSRSRSLPPLKKERQACTKLSPPKIWKDFHYVNEHNRPKPGYLDLERPAKCVWQLESSSRVLRSSMRWQDQCFCPVWKYEMRLQNFLYKKRNHQERAEHIFEAHPLPLPYSQDFSTFMKFISSRSHLFEVLMPGGTPRPAPGRGNVDNKNALIRMRDRASSLLEWKRRMLDYIRVEGYRTGCRVPLAEALLACPFPKDAPVEEVDEAQANIHNYIISRLGDAVHVIPPRRWIGTSVTYSTVELRFFECDVLHFPKRCSFGLEACTTGTSCPYLHVAKRNWGKPLYSGPNTGGKNKQW